MKKLSELANVVLMLCALVVTALVVRREFFSGQSASPDVRTVRGGSALSREGTLLGPPSAQVRIVEFSDFQCPFCARVRTSLAALRSRYPGRVAVVYRHYPLKIHPHAVDAALAAECAGESGRFEAYHDALFSAQEQIGTRSWHDFAREAGVRDLEAFDACVRGRRYLGHVLRDAREGRRIGVDATPALLVGDRMVIGSQAAALLDRWVAESIGAKGGSDGER